MILATKSRKQLAAGEFWIRCNFQDWPSLVSLRNDAPPSLSIWQLAWPCWRSGTNRGFWEAAALAGLGPLKPHLRVSLQFTDFSIIWNIKWTPEKALEVKKKMTPDLIFKIDLMYLCYFIVFLTGIIYIKILNSEVIIHHYFMSWRDQYTQKLYLWLNLFYMVKNNWSFPPKIYIFDIK